MIWLTYNYRLKNNTFVERNPDGIFSIYINDQIMSAISYYTAEGLKN
jgi:hypothetical protein